MGYFFSKFLTFSEYPNFTVKNGITLSLIDDRPIEKFGSSSWLESGNRCSLQKDNFVPPQFIREDIFFLIKKSVIFKMFFSYLQFCQKSNKKMQFNYSGTSSRIVWFVFGRIEDTQKTFRN